MKQKRSLVLVITLVVGLAGCVGGTGDVNGGDGSDGSGSGDVTLVDNRTAVLANAGGYTTPGR
jgi:hypothetical protein